LPPRSQDHNAAEKELKYDAELKSLSRSEEVKFDLAKYPFRALTTVGFLGV
jgi:hypothetical protein